MNTSTGTAERFKAAYAQAYDDVLRFVQRRSDPAQAEDIVAEAMLVAWRRRTDLPADDGDARAWLFGIARNCLLNATRSHRRKDALGVRLADAEAIRPPGLDDTDLWVRRLDLAAAWRRLTAEEQDVLALTVFEQLTSPQAAGLLGITANAYRLRLSRARAALRRHLEGAANATDAPDSHQATDREMTR